jgi:multidrug efflux pump subunit AcrB
MMDAISKKYKTYPGMRSFVSRGSIITSNNGGSRSINLEISGSHLIGIYEVALAAERRAKEVFDNPRVRANPSTLSLSQPLVEIKPDWNKLAETGMTSSELGLTVAALTDGAFVDEFFLDDDKIDIYLYSNLGNQAKLDDLKQLPVYTPAGAVIPLSSIASINETVDTSSIRRVDGKRTVTLNIIPPDNIPLETGVSIVKKDVVSYLQQSGEIPNNVKITISGASDQLDATREALASNYLVALIIIYLLLVAIFSHWGYPILIMTTIPLGIAGGIFGLWFMNFIGTSLPAIGLAEINQSFDMITMLGFLILMGTVVNNPILIVHQSMKARNAGMLAIDAVNNAVETRLKPIAMSTLTTVFGLAPLVMLPGEGTELYRGVGVIVMFGILGSAIVTLTFLPALTVFFLEKGKQSSPT